MVGALIGVGPGRRSGHDFVSNGPFPPLPENLVSLGCLSELGTTQFEDRGEGGQWGRKPRPKALKLERWFEMRS